MPLRTESTRQGFATMPERPARQVSRAVSTAGGDNEPDDFVIVARPEEGSQSEGGNLRLLPKSLRTAAEKGISEVVLQARRFGLVAPPPDQMEMDDMGREPCMIPVTDRPKSAVADQRKDLSQDRPLASTIPAHMMISDETPLRKPTSPLPITGLNKAAPKETAPVTETGNAKVARNMEMSFFLGQDRTGGEEPAEKPAATVRKSAPIAPALTAASTSRQKSVIEEPAAEEPVVETASKAPETPVKNADKAPTLQAASVTGVATEGVAATVGGKKKKKKSKRETGVQ